MKTKIIIVRHAEAEGNAQGRFHGWTDSSITEKGHKQSKALAERLKDEKIDVIISSSLKRTLQTAEYISKAKGIPVVSSKNLKEINGGLWENEKWDDLPNLWSVKFDTWEYSPHIHRMPEGETMEEFYKRLVDEVGSIITEYKGKNICIVTHGTAIRALMTYLYGVGLEKMLEMMWHENASITIVEANNDEYKVVLEGDASHIDKEIRTIKNQDWLNVDNKKIKIVKLNRRK